MTDSERNMILELIKKLNLVLVINDADGKEIGKWIFDYKNSKLIKVNG